MDQKTHKHKRLPKMQSEAQIKRLVSKHLATLGKCYRFMPVQNGMGAPSLDYLCCVNGQFVAIETKAAGKKPTPRQEQTMQAIRNAGGRVFVVDSEWSLYDVIEVLKEL